jgi:hypothetical protein
LNKPKVPSKYTRGYLLNNPKVPSKHARGYLLNKPKVPSKYTRGYLLNSPKVPTGQKLGRFDKDINLVQVPGATTINLFTDVIYRFS